MSNHTATCESCEQLKQLLIDAETANAELGRQLAGMDLLIRRAGQTEVALRNELAKQREEEPEAPEIRAVLDHWKQTLGHAKAKTPLSGERAKKVRARLRERFTVDDLKKAINGCAKAPYVGPHGRKPTGKKVERHDDLTLICRDEETVERFMRYDDEPPGQKSVEPSPQPVVSGPRGVVAVLDRLENVTQVRAGQWSARCPAHEDRHASLSVGQGDKGAVLHCHTGCTTDAIVGALRLELTALFDPDGAPPARPITKKPRQPERLPDPADLERWVISLQQNGMLLDRLHELRRWSASTLDALNVGWHDKRLTLPIYDQHQQLVNVLRYLPRTTNGERKMLALAGRPRDLWPAPETIDGEVWLVEGEPDAISGHQIGLPAVAIPGANGWRPEWGLRLKDRRVVICVDCDKPGRDLARRVFNDLRAVADVVILNLEPEREDGYDLSDALLDGADKEILTALADAILSEWVA